MSRIKAIANWVDERLHLTDVFDHTAGHKVPRKAGSWWYVFGSATLTCFLLQLLTGVCLALIYVPSANEAYDSLEYLTYQQPMGWFLRAMHYWSSNFMVALMTVHMAQVFLFGAFKYPRELTWVSGCVLFLLTLGMAFTGQVLRWDQDAYWGLGISTSMAGRVPIIGAQVVQMVLGGATIGGETLSRFFSLHVFVVPGLMIAMITMHLRLVLTKGINEYPEPGKRVDKATYADEYDQLIKKTGVPFYKVIDKDLVFSGLVILGILLCSALLGPKGPGGEPDPTLIDTVPRPDFYFLSLFALFALLPPYLESLLILTAPPLAIGLLFAIPFISGTGEKSARKRPLAVVCVVVIFVTVFSLAWLGVVSPWSPQMDAWTGTPTPVHYVTGRTPLELQGAVLLQEKQCRTCHSLDGSGGMRGPDLAGVATRLTHDQLIRQVIQGSGNMPAYGKHLSPSEVTALVAFMETLRPANTLPVRDARAPFAPEPRPAAGDAPDPGAAPPR